MWEPKNKQGNAGAIRNFFENPIDESRVTRIRPGVSIRPRVLGSWSLASLGPRNKAVTTS